MMIIPLLKRFVFFSLFGACLANAQINLILNDTVYVKKLPVTLGDLVQPDSRVLLRDDILTLPVVDRLNLGGQRLLTAEILSARLKRNPGLALVNFQITPSRIILVRPYRDIRFGEFQKAVERYVNSKFREEHFAVSIEIDSEDRILKVPEGDVIPSFSHYSELKGGKNSLMMSLSNGSDFNLNVALSVTIRTWDKVPVALHLMEPYSKITRDDVKWEIRETTYIPYKYIIMPGELTDQSKVLHLIDSDEIVSRDNIKSPPLIPRGAPITLYVVKGNIRIQAPGVALQNGEKNAVIWVKNSYTGKKMKAKVVDKEHVLITAL